MVQLFGPCWGVAMPGRFKEYFVKSSDPYERGLQHGRQAAAEIISTLPAYQKLFTQKGLSWEEIKAQEHEGREWEKDYLPDAFRESKELLDRVMQRKGISISDSVTIKKGRNGNE